MKRLHPYLLVSLTGLLLSLILGLGWAARQVDLSSNPSRGPFQANWSPAAAASYLDYRESWWQHWAGSQRGHGTVCVSCHTALPYALGRPGLTAQLGQAGSAPGEAEMLKSIRARVMAWTTSAPYYADAAHRAPSRSTESVLNALVLSFSDRRADQFSPITRRAFDQAWALQTMSGKDAGGWPWQDFQEAPWESSESAYWGTSLMAIAVGNAPLKYRDDPAVRAHIVLLQNYLRNHYSEQPPINQLYVVWAAVNMPALLSSEQRRQLVARIDALQDPDGGWPLASLDAPRSLKLQILHLFRVMDRVDGSDACGTALAVLGLENTGVSIQNVALERGLNWLRQHQYRDGSWFAPSLNGLRKPNSELGRFMSDAATGYAVLALERARKAEPTSAAAQKRRADVPSDGHSGQFATSSGG